MARDGGGGAGQHLALHAFDIDLEKMACQKIERIDGNNLDALPGHPRIERDTAEIIGLAVIEKRHMGVPTPRPRPRLERLHPGELIEREIGAEDLMDDAL